MQVRPILLSILVITLPVLVFSSIFLLAAEPSMTLEFKEIEETTTNILCWIFGVSLIVNSALFILIRTKS